MTGTYERRAVERRVDPVPQEVFYGVDRRGTAERSEMRFLAPHAIARETDRIARANLRLGDVEADLPWYTTTYCDTADRAIYRAAEQGSSSLLRLREYHARRPERALASRRIWIEWKNEERDRSKKERFIVRPVDVAPFLRGEGAPAARIEADGGSPDLFARRSRPVVVTQCRRVAYSSRRDDIRITFDHELTYLAPEDPLADEPVPCPLGPILAREPDIVVELKWQQVVPAWLGDLVADLAQRSEGRPPKFVVAMRHLAAHADRERALVPDRPG